MLVNLSFECTFDTIDVTKMKSMFKKVYTLLASMSVLFAQAQVVTIDPPFPTQNDEVTITYNALEGNGELAGVVPVYMHSGVILEGENGWQNVQGNWGTADANVLMNFQSPNTFTKTINISEFYNLQPGDVVLQLAFVFRNAGGTLVGREADGSDIFVDIAQGGFTGGITSAAGPAIFIDPPSDFGVTAQTNSASSITLYLDDEVIDEALNATLLNTEIDFTGFDVGQYWVWMDAVSDADGSQVFDSTYVIIQGAPQIQNPPAGTIDGINYINDNTVILQLHAPFKDYVYVLGDFNDWQFNPDYFCKKTTSGDRWWVQINNLNAGQEYRFQYSIGPEDMRIADVYCEKVLDPWNDPWIDEDRYPGLIPYPQGLTTQIVGVLQTAQEPYDWNVVEFERPPKEQLVVYELLVRDFTEARTYRSLIDTLDYLDNLGVNAIQLMPINEFEGNESWGYNPMFYFAVDKYYGPADDLKEFVDKCHERGIAVILDVVYNHSFGQNPQVRMYFDPSAGPFGQPTAQNPWFNEVEKHPFNVGYDYNHDSPHTQAFVKRSIHYWIEEFKIDGYRFDLSKGFTQNNTLGNVGAWNQYDQSRIDHWLRIRDEIAEVDDDLYLILEHFANNDEETVLANSGFLLWGNMHHEFNEATMGYSSSLNGASYQERNWNEPNLVSYGESHDEERLMFKNQEFGNQSNPDHDTRDLEVGLARVEASMAIHLPLVGPKMIWQFGELGYDYSINYCPDGTINPDCRTANKPVRWDYWDEPARQRLYRVTAAINKLKTENEAFQSTNFTWDVGGFGKRLIIQHPSMDVVIIANFSVNEISMVPGFTQAGTWYDYMTGEGIVETNLNNPFLLQPGEYRIYTSEALETPDLTVGVDDVEPGKISLSAYPNPFADQTQVAFKLDEPQEVQIRVVDINGREIALVDRSYRAAGNHMVRWNGVSNHGGKAPNGFYMIQLIGRDATGTAKVLLQR